MVCNNCGAPPTSAQATWCTKCAQPLSDEKSTRRPGLGVSATPPAAVSAPNTPRDFSEGVARIALRKAGRIASPLASYLRHLLAEAGQYLGRMGLDVLDAGRLLLLRRARRSTPERAGQIEVALPAGVQDGTASIQVTDPVSGAFSQMIGALSYGALSTDLLLLLQGAEPLTPVGSAAANAIRVRVVAANGITPAVRFVTW